MRRPTAVKGRYLLGLDFDGTLAPLAARPGLARLPRRNRELLRRLARLKGVRVAIASGRAIDDVKRKVGLDGLIYIGNHGLEIERRRRRWVHPQARAASRLMQRVAARLAGDLAEFPGVFVENKGLTLSVHYRRLPRWLSPRPVREMLDLLVDGQKDKLRLSAGKKVWDIRPRLEWNKGFALRRLAAGGEVLILIGDDATDEEGFRSLGPEALTVRVGYKKDSHARFRLKSQKHVAAMLAHFLREWGRVVKDDPIGPKMTGALSAPFLSPRRNGNSGPKS